MAKPPKPAGPPPDRARLRDAAMRHLSRFAATEAGLVRVLDRAIQRWAVRAGSEGHDFAGAVPLARSLARQVAAELVQAGIVDDGAYALARAGRLRRAGRSRRAVAAHLAERGVDSATVASVLPGHLDEVPAALAFARRRRMGPFRPVASAELRLRDLGALARAGFPRDVAERVLDLDPDAAECAVLALRRG